MPERVVDRFETIQVLKQGETLASAHITMNQAKQSGRNIYRFFQREAAWDVFSLFVP